MNEMTKSNCFKTSLLNCITLPAVLIIIFCFVFSSLMTGPEKCFAEVGEWVKGGPKSLYTKAKKVPPLHPVYEESIKCVECHKYDGVDAYTSATMSLKKSKIFWEKQ